MKHRGAHPKDLSLFAQSEQAALKDACSHLSWLLSRSYQTPSALKLVGDRFRLSVRQREAVRRCSCTDQQLKWRQERLFLIPEIGARTLFIDGFNVLTTIEAVLAGGVLLRGRDGCLRDMASMHGNYRKVVETEPAIALVGQYLARHGTKAVQWYLDQPVSNSGRLAQMLRSYAEQQQLDWSVELVPDPDPLLKAQTEGVVATADGGILEEATRINYLAGEVIDAQQMDTWLLDFSETSIS